VIGVVEKEGAKSLCYLVSDDQTAAAVLQIDTDKYVLVLWEIRHDIVKVP
jgi:hypothetical protein